MKCPICKKPVPEGSRFAPFCSERCKLIDLGNWSAEKYVIVSPVEPASEAREEKEDSAE